MRGCICVVQSILLNNLWHFANLVCLSNALLLSSHVDSLLKFITFLYLLCIQNNIELPHISADGHVTITYKKTPPA